MILTETLTYKQANSIVESIEDKETGKKNLYMKGIFIQGGIKNHNERIYPVHEIRKAVDSINHKISQDISICGENDHPTELTINLDRISHVIEEMWMQGNDGYGKLRILRTPQGMITRTLIEEGVKLGVSSRGIGNVDDRGEVSGFDIVTVDIVMNPSAPKAFPNPIFESSEMRTARKIRELAEATIYDDKARKHLAKMLLQVVNDLY